MPAQYTDTNDATNDARTHKCIEASMAAEALRSVVPEHFVFADDYPDEALATAIDALDAIAEGQVRMCTRCHGLGGSRGSLDDSGDAYQWVRCAHCMGSGFDPPTDA